MFVAVRIGGSVTGYLAVPPLFLKLIRLSPPEMAERLGMDLGTYQEWEGEMQHLRGEAVFPSPAELLRLLVKSKRA